jgi:hypothetical protein
LKLQNKELMKRGIIKGIIKARLAIAMLKGIS